MKLYSYIKDYADNYGISIHKLEQRTGLTNGTIRRWDECVPKVDNLLAVVEFFDLDIKEVIKCAENYEQPIDNG